MKGEIKRAGKRDGQTTTISKLFRKRCAVSLPSVEEAAVARNFSSVDASRMHGSLERNGSRRGVRLHVKTISLPTLRHFQVGSPNTDRRLFQSALASTGAPSPLLILATPTIPRYDSTSARPRYERGWRAREKRQISIRNFPLFSVFTEICRFRNLYKMGALIRASIAYDLH